MVQLDPKHPIDHKPFFDPQSSGLTRFDPLTNEDWKQVQELLQKQDSAGGMILCDLTKAYPGVKSDKKTDDVNQQQSHVDCPSIWFNPDRPDEPGCVVTPTQLEKYEQRVKAVEKVGKLENPTEEDIARRIVTAGLSDDPETAKRMIDTAVEEAKKAGISNERLKQIAERCREAVHDTVGDKYDHLAVGPNAINQMLGKLGGSVERSLPDTSDNPLQGGASIESGEREPIKGEVEDRM